MYFDVFCSFVVMLSYHEVEKVKHDKIRQKTPSATTTTTATTTTATPTTIITPNIRTQIPFPDSSDIDLDELPALVEQKHTYTECKHVPSSNSYDSDGDEDELADDMGAWDDV